MSDKENIQQIYPLTSMQEGMLFHTLRDESNAYFSQTTYTALGRLSQPILTQSLEQLALRHDILRTSFVYEKVEQPLQVVLKSRRIALRFDDLTALDAAAQQEFLRAFKTQDVARGFDLTRDPLIRLSVFQTGPAVHEFVWSYHHMLMDGWCMGTLLSELKEIYLALSEARPVSLAPAVPFSRYIQWLGRQDKAAATAYWNRYLLGYETLATIPPDAQPAAGAHFGAPTVEALTLAPAKAQRLEAWARQHHTTLNTVFQAVWGILLARYTGTQDVVYGSVVSGRPADIPGIDQMIGLFINTMPVRVRFADDTRFSQLVAQLHQDSIEAVAHHHQPLVDIQAGSSLRHNLIHHVVAFENYPVEESLLDNDDARYPFSIGNVGGFEQTSYNLDLDVELGGGLTVTLYFNPQYYTPAYMRQVVGHLEYLLEQVLDNPEVVVTELEIVTPQERETQFTVFNQGAVDLGNDQPINVRFEAQAARHATAPAVLHNGTTWTYAQLNELANRLGHQLQQQGVAAGDFVGIHLERTPELVAGILAILKLGGVYVPLDTQNPVARTLELMGSSQLKGLLTDAAGTRRLLAAAPAEAEFPVVLSLDELPAELRTAGQARGISCADATELVAAPVTNLPNQNQLDSWAYLLYTSGSTGLPKGAITRHDGALNHILAEFAALELADGFRFLQSASISSDISVWQILAPLLKGGAVVIIDKDDLLSYESLLGTLRDGAVTIAEFVPSYLLGLTEYLSTFYAVPAALPALRWMMMVGEEVPVKLVNQWLGLFPGCRVLNGYGPCEASDDITQYVIAEPLPAAVRKVPIGRPIANMNIVVVDRHGRLLPVGVAGELLVSGVGVGAGYFREPEKTAESFVPNRFAGTLGPTLYRTGDLARWLPDGNLEFLGRLDSQVKIRGYRVELGEIENRLRTCPAVQDAAVLIKPYQGEKQPIAYIVPRQPEALATEAGRQQLRQQLQDFVADKLAAFMHPADYVLLPAFPLNLSDKVDRKALPEPGAAPDARPLLAPANPTEAGLLAIWQKVLDRPHISTDDNFFEIGGHSLKATRLTAHVNKTFDASISVRTIFAAPTIQQLSRQILAGTGRYRAIPVAPAQATYPLSHAQRRLWLVNQLAEDQYSYNMTAAYVIDGCLNPAALAQALRQLVARHEMLRTVFVTEAGEPRQRVLTPAEAAPALRYDDWRGQGLDRATALGQAQDDFRTVFELDRGPLFQARLIQLGAEEFVFVLVLHHIIADGWSADILIGDLFEFYRAAQYGTAPTLKPLPVQYKDFAVWHNQELAGESAERHRAYWQGQFADEIPVLELPTDFARPAQRSQRGATVEVEVDAATVAALKQLSARHGGTLFMGLIASVKALLYRYTGQLDLVVGTVVSGREHSDLEDQIGFYVNTLALRTRFAGTDSFAALLDHVKQVTLGAFEHQTYPFDELVDDLSLARELSRSPLFDVLVVLQNNGSGDDGFTGLPELRVIGADVAQEYSKFDLTVEVWENAGGTLTVALEYSTDLFGPARISRMAGHYVRLLRAALADVHAPIQRLDYLSEAEKAELRELAGPATPRPVAQTVPALFEQVAAEYAAAVAVGDETRELTYAQLNAQANQLAHCLRQQYDVQAESVVAILLGRRAEFVTAMLGTLKAGGAYLPLEANLPPERLRSLLAETRAKVLITDVPELAAALQATHPCLLLDTADLEQYSPENQPAPGLRADSLAYVMFTSGSTGKPKGVMIEHRGIIRLVRDTAYTTFGPAQRVLQTGSLAFDAATFEIWAPLLHGGQVHLLSLDHLLDTEQLRAAIERKGITQMWFTSSWFNQLAEENPTVFAGLASVLVGGEQLSPRHLRRVQEHCPQLRIINGYGPTENTTFSLCGPVAAPAPEHIPLGRPIANSTVFVVDGLGQLVPKGVAGELWLGGEGLARGYWQDAERTAKQFVPNPFGPGRLYRSGDLGRWREDGQLEFLGRLDDQVKIRGFRIEPAEIANVLKTYPGLTDAFVLVQPDAAGDKLLVAYYLAPGVPATALKLFLKERLPAYMVPTLFVELAAVPLNRNGKLDRAALPNVTPLLAQASAARPAATPTESRLLAIWEAVLGRPGIGTTDNFFEIGGNSLKAVRILSRIQTELGRKVGLATFFQNPAVQPLAAVVDQLPAALEAGIPRVAEAARYEVSRAQKRLWIMDQLDAERAAYNIAGAYVLDGAPDVTLLEEAIRRLLARHEILRTAFVEDGGQPYQHVSTPAQIPFALPVERVPPAQDFDAAVQRALNAEESHVFALDQLPLIRFRLLTNGPRQVLVLNLHHIIGDGWSLQLLLSEVEAHYRTLQGRAAALEPLPLQYKDFAAWHNGLLTTPEFARHEQYWRRQLANQPAPPELPLDRPRAAVRGYACAVLPFELGVEQADILRTLCQEHDASLFMGLQAVVKAWLSQHLRTTDVTVGTTTAGRDQPELAGQIGCYVNVLALRTRVDEAGSFRDLLTAVRQDTLGAFEHQAYPFDLLIEKLNVRRDLRRNLLFDVMLTFLDGFETDADDPTGLTLRDWRQDGQESFNKYDLTLAFQSRPSGAIAGELIYNTDLFFAASARALRDSLLALATQAPQHPDQPLALLQAAAQPEAVSLEDDFN